VQSSLVLFSLVSYMFNAIPTTVVLPHLLFPLQSPLKNDGSGFHCSETEDRGGDSMLAGMR
jgi:hypothetical protein